MIFTLPWCETGPPNHYDDKVDSKQQVVNKELSLRSAINAHFWPAQAIYLTPTLQRDEIFPVPARLPGMHSFI